MTKAKGLFLAVAAAAMAFTVSCSGDDGGGGNDDRDSRLVCGNGEAWISTYYGDMGSIFYQNGKLEDIEKSGNDWYFISYEDEGVKGVTWSTSGGKLVYHATTTDGRKATIEGYYSISGDTLTLEIMGSAGSFTKKTGIYPLSSSSAGGSSPSSALSSSSSSSVGGQVYQPSSSSFKDTEIVQSFSLTLGEPFGPYIQNLTIDVQFIGNPNNEDLNPDNGGKGLDSVRIRINNDKNIHVWKSTESSKQLNFSYNETFNIDPVDAYCGREYPICVEVYAMGKSVGLGDACKALNRDASRCNPSSSPSSSSNSSVLPSSSSVSGVVYGAPVTYGGETYQTVVIGTQTWFAKNLNYDPGTGTSACYGNNPDNCATYGRLYDWSTAMTACPSGWHLPRQKEWEVMTAFIGGASTEGKKLKTTSGWTNIGNGTDEYGFSALPGGYGYSDGSFLGVGYGGRWWSASENNSDNALSRGMNFFDEDANWNDYDKSALLSVRCLQD